MRVRTLKECRLTLCSAKGAGLMLVNVFLRNADQELPGRVRTESLDAALRSTSQTTGSRKTAPDSVRLCDNLLACEATGLQVASILMGERKLFALRLDVRGSSFDPRNARSTLMQ